MHTKFGRPSHATVIAYLALFVALGSGAYAAKQLPKNSVGTKQLKKKSVGTSQLKGNAVTKNKIKKNSIVMRKIRGGAVSRQKIQNNAVNGAKILDGSVTGTDINVPTTPFARIVHEARGNATVPVPKEGEGPGLYPLNNATYTQEAERDDTYLGALDVTFKATCTSPRQVLALIVLDPANLADPEESDVVGFGFIEDEGAGEVSRRINIGGQGGRIQPGVPTNHTIYLGTRGECTAGEGITATFGAVDVIGTK
ncbi:MAG TPA: hypothetical protein VFZ41_04440 [Solirubrobacterales bacterium]